MINLHESMVPGRDQTLDPWICSQTHICSQARYRLRYAARSPLCSLLHILLKDGEYVCRRSENCKSLVLQEKMQYLNIFVPYRAEHYTILYGALNYFIWSTTLYYTIKQTFLVFRRFCQPLYTEPWTLFMKFL